jgi:hypothetical protein
MIAIILQFIILLNLLISIVSDTFGRIKSNYTIIMYKDMLHLINENSFLYFGSRSKKLTGKYLYLGEPVQDSAQDQLYTEKISSIERLLKESNFRQ